ncbi:MAG: hypothetical protein HRT61_14160 [Ekhidna sp.]|nr:hypothetical protein [Ekhidna sp.]
MLDISQKERNSRIATERSFKSFMVLEFGVSVNTDDSKEVVGFHYQKKSERFISTGGKNSPLDPKESILYAANFKF